MLNSLESTPTNSRDKVFSVSSAGTKAWIRQGAEMLAEYLDGEGTLFCLTLSESLLWQSSIS